MTAAPAKYLLRLDDLCPTFSRQRWMPFQALTKEFRLKPILAIVADNRDPELQISTPDRDFWEQMQALESAGAAIGLHGYHHLCLSRGRGLLGLHRATEFAGVEMRTQRAWIGEGLRILRSHGLDPRIWVAPRHGFDRNTLEALRAEGLPVLSDGFGSAAFLREGVTWIPQQLWRPVEKASGLWTICVHSNTARDEEITALRKFLASHAAQFTSVDEVLVRFQPATLTLAERFQAEVALRRFKISQAVGRARREALFGASKSA